MRAIQYFGLIALAPIVSGAATLQFTSGSNGSTVLFQDASGDPLIDGHVFAGTFAAPPSVGLSLLDIKTDFATFAPLSSNPTSAFGFVGNSTFSGDLAGFASSKIYLLVLDTDDVDTATQHAVISSVEGGWQFQANESGFDPAIDLTLADQYFAGAAGTITNPGGVGGTFNTIQLIPEPGACMLMLLGMCGLARRRR